MNNNEINMTAVDPTATSTENENPINLIELFFYLLNKFWIILIVTIICGVSAYFIDMFTTEPLYESTAKLFLIPKTDITTSTLTLARNTVDDCVKIIKDEVVVQEAINNLGLDISYPSVKSNMTVGNEEDSLIISVSVRNADPQTACNLVNEICNVSVVKVKNIVGLDQVNIMDNGRLASSPCNLSFGLTAVKAALVGFVGVCAVLFVVFYFDDKIKRSEDIERYLGLTVLGVIPRIENKEQKK